jgi:exodeoxyribonuclease V
MPNTSHNNFQQLVESYFLHSFTEDQKNAMDVFMRFFKSEKQLCLFILQGFAGTGKSSLIAAIVKSLLKIKIKTCLLAPTGRAAKVLSSFANTPAHTIHKQIYFSRNELSIQKPTLAKNSFENTLFFVDEASMIGISDKNNETNLLEDLLNFVYQGKNCKLIFMGDCGQLPPVGQIDSPALSSTFFSENYPKIKVFKAELKNVVRTAEHSSILTNATFIRDKSIFAAPFFRIINNKETFRIAGGDLQDYLETSYNEVGMDQTILVTLSNKRANQWNQEIRGRILLREEIMERGDILMVVKNNYFWLDPQSEIGFIANGELIKVKRIIRFEDLYGFHFVHLEILFLDYPQETEKTVIVMTEALFEEAPNLKREKLKELFYTIEQDYLYEKNKQKRFQLVLKNPYFSALQVKYAYAVTVHKAQGGQWKHVFLDYGFVPDELKNENYIPWLYTALTRASEKLFLLNFPDEFFSDKVN